MSLKRRIGRPFDIGSHDAGFTDSLKSQANSPNQKSELATDWVRLEEIRPDPDNPRKLDMSLEKLLRETDSIENAKERDIVEGIRGLAASIRAVGMSNPIEMYRDGSIFRIVSGERRYWACRYLLATATEDERASLSEVRATIYRSKPKLLRHKQFAENRQRSKLEVSDQMHSVLAAIEEMDPEAKASALESGRALAEALHIHKREGGVWQSVLLKWPSLKPIIAAGKFNSVYELSRLLAQPDEVISKAIPKIAQYGLSDELLAGLNDAEEKKDKASVRKPGRPRAAGVQVRLRLTPQGGQRLSAILARDLGLPDLAKIDWSEPKQLNKGLKLIMEKLNGSD